MRGVLEVLDTRNDFRILVAEDAIDRLEKSVRGKRIPYPFDKHRALSLLRKIRANVMKIKFSLMPSEMLIYQDFVIAVNRDAVELAKIILPREKPANIQHSQALLLAELRYALRILIGLPARLALGDENRPEYAIDIEAVKLLSVHKHPNADRLYIARGKGRYTVYTIVTNIPDVRVGEIRAVAILPPAGIRGEISEAMICSGPLEGVEVGKRPPLDMIYSKEVVAKVYEIVSKR